VVAVADCFMQKCDDAAKQIPGGDKWKKYQNHREMFEKEKLDAVFVETSTHSRVFILMHALQAGLDVYAEKPQSLTVTEGRALVNAVKKTNRVIVAHEDQLTCGFGAELAARIADELFEHLDAPVRRVAALDTPVAYYPDLEEVILPQSADVLKAIQDIARY